MKEQTTTTEPLYKVLNGKRTPGYWRADARQNLNNSIMPYMITVPYNGFCQPVFDTAAFPPNNDDNLIRMKADAEYTALAVNNFANTTILLEQCYLTIQRQANKEISFAIRTDSLRAALRNQLSISTGEDMEDLQNRIEKEALKTIS